MPRTGAVSRGSIANENVPNMVGQISTALADAKLNIADLLNKSRGELAYTLIDLDGAVKLHLFYRRLGSNDRGLDVGQGKGRFRQLNGLVV